MEPLLELRGVTKRFPGVLANDHINLTLEKGEIHALLGENGAGKTTLMNILYGLYDPDEGEILVNGKKVAINNPTDAINVGIGMVHQHFMLIPVFTVTENVMLGEEVVKNGGFLDRAKAAERILAISEQYKLNVNPNDLVENLPVGIQQRVEIIKLLFRDADILILDEPTAVLTPQEVEELFKILHLLVDKGKSIIFITHKLAEVMVCADRITVIRNGRVVGTTTPEKSSTKELAAMMVGRDVELQVKKKDVKKGEVALSVRHLKVSDPTHHLCVNNISFEVRAGEILGIAGVQGNGQTELVKALTGLIDPLGGEIQILGQETTYTSPRKITELGSAHIPEDRQKDGLVLDFPVADNLVLNTYYLPPFSRGIMTDQQMILENGKQLIENFDIRTPSAITKVSSLSGGNQQKVIVAREFSRPIKLLIAAQPTRGLDVGSIEYIHQRLIEKRDEGTAVLIVSTELDEILQLADRIAVMYRGEIIAVLDSADANKEVVGLLMAGIKPDEETLKKARAKKEKIIMT